MKKWGGQLDICPPHSKNWGGTCPPHPPRIDAPGYTEVRLECTTTFESDQPQRYLPFNQKLLMKSKSIDLMLKW